jgi:uncharacterized protein YndB with AHSA1/START domain
VTEQQAVCPPDLSSRPPEVRVERTVAAGPATVYRAWTEQFDRWFAVPGTVLMVPEVNAPFFFETVHQGNRAPHYGRFLRLDPDRVVEMTWMNAGTGGAETVLSVDLTPAGTGTCVRLAHGGFPTEAIRAAHEAAWPLVLEQFDRRVR